MLSTAVNSTNIIIINIIVIISSYFDTQIRFGILTNDFRLVNPVARYVFFGICTVTNIQAYTIIRYTYYIVYTSKSILTICGGFLKQIRVGKLLRSKWYVLNRFLYASFTSNRRCSVSLNQRSDQKLSCDALTTKHKPF